MITYSDGRKNVDVNEFIRDRFRQAREEKRLSQREMAEILNVSQATVSGIETGRVKVNAADLHHFSQVLEKPITYFFPAGPESNNQQEHELLNLFRSLPGKWKERVLYLVRTQIKLRERILPYERAGIPEEFYSTLLWQVEEGMELETASVPTDEESEEGQQFYQRFLDWLNDTDKKMHSQPD